MENIDYHASIVSIAEKINCFLDKVSVELCCSFFWGTNIAVVIVGVNALTIPIFLERHRLFSKLIAHIQ